MSKKINIPNLCTKCNGDFEEVWTFGGYLAEYVHKNDWFCIDCFRKKEKEILRKIEKENPSE